VHCCDYRTTLIREVTRFIEASTTGSVGGLVVLLGAMALGMYKPKAATRYEMRNRDSGAATFSATRSSLLSSNRLFNSS
jgi:hypothetical protein